MKPLAAIICPPLYFFLQGRPLAAGIHLIFWILSILTAIIFIGVFIWFIQSSMACWDLRKQLMEEQATIMAKKMAEAMGKPDRAA